MEPRRGSLIKRGIKDQPTQAEEPPSNKDTRASLRKSNAKKEERPFGKRRRENRKER